MARVTPENVSILRDNQCILIGTNEAGIHDAGIARYAAGHWGARVGQGFGEMGQCFGLPTKDFWIRQLPLNVIAFYADRYIFWGSGEPQLEHLVTKVGCGLAGYTVPDIAPMFKKCLRFSNFWLPQDFLDFYDGIYKANTNDDGTSTNGTSTSDQLGLRL